MSEATERAPRRRRGRWLVRLLVLSGLIVGGLVVLDGAGRLPPGIQRACEDAGLCGHAFLPGTSRATRLDFAVGAGRDTRQATRAQVTAERQGENWLLGLRVEALPGAQRYSLIQVLATRERPGQGEPELLTLHDESRQPVVRGYWEVAVTVPNEVFRNRDWVLHYRADTIDALAISEDIAPFIRQAGAIR